MKFHPFAEVFPLLEGTPFDELVEDIKTFGLREKIWLYDGKVLDGRNRFLACQKAKVKPQYRTFKGTDQGALAHVISTNIHRRHLTESQRAMAGARIATLRNGQRSDEVAGVPIGTAAQAVNASERSTKRARKVLDKGSKELQRAVDAGEVSVSRAAAVVELPKSEQLAAAKKPAEEPKLSDDWTPEENEDEVLAATEKELATSLDKVMAADDKLAAARKEIERQAAEIASLRISRDGYLNRCGELTRSVKSLRRRLAKYEDPARGTSENGVSAQA